jgi:transcriptional regulator with XRE-family HTH domain
MNQKELAINILMLLQRKNLNLKELATALNLEPKYLKNKIYKMLKGKEESFSFEIFIKLIKFLNVNLKEFIF